MNLGSRLDGKVGVVTGGARGIGRAVAERLVAEGARVVVADIDGDAAETAALELGSAASAVQFDASLVADIERMFTTTVERHGRLDILHNNAAIMGPETSGDHTAVDTPVELWDRIMSVNLRAYFLGCKYAIPHMIEGGGGSIIQMASTSGMLGDGRWITYGTSKAGVIGLTRYVAAQHGRQGIRCNTVVPGLIATSFVEEHDQDLIRMVEPHLLVPRMGRPDDIAAMVAYLAADESGYVTGQTLQVDGGWVTAMPFLAQLRETDPSD